MSSLRRRMSAALFAVSLLVVLVLPACGGDASMSCGKFGGLDVAGQSEVIASLTDDFGFVGKSEDIERLRMSAERACGADGGQTMGDVVKGLVAVLTD